MRAERINLKEESELLDALQGELNYQYEMSDNDRADYIDNGVAGQLVTLDTYLRKAQDDWTLNAGDEKSLHQIRKLAATAIRTMVQYGITNR